MNIENIDTLKNKVVTSNNTDIYHFQLEGNSVFRNQKKVACAVRYKKSEATEKQELKINDEKLENKRACKKCIKTLKRQLSNVVMSCKMCNRVNVSHDAEYEHVFTPHAMEGHRNNMVCENCLDIIHNSVHIDT
jgi:hypothetical protein